MKPNQYNLTQDEQDELDAFLMELDTQARLEQDGELAPYEFNTKCIYRPVAEYTIPMEKDHEA